LSADGLPSSTPPRTCMTLTPCHGVPIDFEAVPASLFCTPCVTSAGSAPPCGAFHKKHAPALLSGADREVECDGRAQKWPDCLNETTFRMPRVTRIDAALRSDIETFYEAPVLSSAFRSSVPGLHFVGIASALSFGPVMRFVHGAKYAATILAAHLRSPARSRDAPARIALGSRVVNHLSEAAALAQLCDANASILAGGKVTGDPDRGDTSSGIAACSRAPPLLPRSAAINSRCHRSMS